jgi:hypothetical protein
MDTQRGTLKRALEPTPSTLPAAVLSPATVVADLVLKSTFRTLCPPEFPRYSTE